MAACEGFLDRHPEDSGAMAAKVIPLGENGKFDVVGRF